MRRSPSFLGPIPPSHSGLLRRLLDQIRSFHHESASLSSKGEETAEEVDLVISGGGMKGYFVTGAFAVLSGQIIHVKVLLYRFVCVRARVFFKLENLDLIDMMFALLGLLIPLGL